LEFLPHAAAGIVTPTSGSETASGLVIMRIKMRVKQEKFIPLRTERLHPELDFVQDHMFRCYLTAAEAGVYGGIQSTSICAQYASILVSIISEPGGAGFSKSAI
jgi:hypothetical protein